MADGLGPRFNLDSCAGCHLQPGVGGSSPKVNSQIQVAKAFGAMNQVPSFIKPDGPVREARLRYKPDGSRDGGVHALFVISSRVDGPDSDALADDILQGVAEGDEFRTAPLWGLGQRIFFLHDGRTNDLVQAILAHQSPANAKFQASEANGVINRYRGLGETQKQDLLNFLRSL